MNLMAMLSFGIVFTNHIDYINTQLNNNIKEYGEIDREQLCKIAQCVRVASVDLKKCYTPGNKGHLTRVEYRENIFNKIKGSLYITDTYQLTVYNETANTHFALNTDDIFKEYISLMTIFVPLSLLLFIYPLIRSISNEQEEALIMLAGNEALLANKSMINITENIHHELNTPLEVIDNKIEKIRRVLSDFLLDQAFTTSNLEVSEERRTLNRKLSRLEEDFQFIRSSSEQIYSVLEKMKGFKHLRYSNGNKSIKNIIDGGFKIINISNTNFEFKVDKKLSKYRIDSKLLKNADLLSVTLNHIKNSLEANSSKVYILFAGYQNNYLRVRIIDNGKGIPKKVQRDIFCANFSTKNDDGSIRGNGMYLNRHIIRTAKGEISLISSSTKGTTIELKIPANEK